MSTNNLPTNGIVNCDHKHRCADDREPLRQRVELLLVRRLLCREIASSCNALCVGCDLEPPEVSGTAFLNRISAIGRYNGQQSFERAE